jgi:precorrin-3B C17-methyltransferase
MGEAAGRLWVVGIGPGDRLDLTERARLALAQAEVLVGYPPFLRSLGELAAGKRRVATGMGGEVERCRRAVELARSGERVAVVSSGDPGVYGMAGLVLELLREGAQVPVEVVPGVTAATAAAALLGAPLMHDFAVVSLSDLLTPWDVIEARLRAVAAADFVLALYNVRSRGRPDHLRRAADVLLEARDGSTPVGMVGEAGRTGSRVTLTDLAHLGQQAADMLTTVIIGSRGTFRVGDRMITPRGYRL